MKTMKKSILLVIVMLAFVTSIYAQPNSATATATATVVAPLSINKTGDLNFGSFSAAAAGTVIIDNAATISATGGVVLINGGAGSTVATFTIAGQSGLDITLGLPALPITLTSGGNTMDITALDSSIPAGTYTLAAASTTLTVGGTLDVAAAQPAGVYTNAGSLIVTVNYN
jgi:hypothetical protein